LYTTRHNGPSNPQRPASSGGWRARPRWRLCRGSEIALGPGKADLLQRIRETGSISGAARALGMSYRRAWLLVDTMNRCFTRPLVATSRWRGKGASLTAEGNRVLDLYREIESSSLFAARRSLAKLESLARRPDSPELRRRATKRLRP
jgi:molybdate transport system regulatory protein